VALLTPADVKRWDPDAIHGVFQTASNRAATLQRLGDNLQQVHATLIDWHGDAGDAFRADLGKTRRDIEADGQESKQVAAAVSLAEADVRGVKSELGGIEQTAEGYGFSITADWRIDPGMGAVGFDKLTLAAEEQLLQGQLDTCKLHAHNADQELANAVRGAVGDAPVSAGAPDGKPKSLQDMLLPAGPASAQPGGDPAKGPPVPDPDGMPPSLEDMLLGRGRPADQAPPGSAPDLLSRLKPPAVPPQQLDPAAIESFKAMARQSMIAEGVPPDQIEGRLNDAVARTQQWMNAGMPPYVAPPPPRPPAPGFGDRFGDRWNSSITGIQDLVGANGLDAMGDAWGGTAKGLAGKAEEYLTLGPAAPIADAAGEVKSFMDNPAGYLGEKAADGALALPGMMFGPEALGLGPEVGLVDDYAGMVRPPNVPVGLDNPTVYHPFSQATAEDLYTDFLRGNSTTTLQNHLADMATHYVGDNPDRVVLGKWDGQDSGYIGEAREHGGIFFDTGTPTWKAMADGLEEPAEHAVAWPVNEQFLRAQMENHVPRIEYVLPDGFDSVDQVALQRRETYSAMEINFLNQHAAEFGYRRVGNEWVYGTG
jgi:uncharacterized protein YukE